MIVVLASFRLPLASVDSALELLPQFIAETLAENGCHRYDVARDALDSGLFRVSEIWESRDALDQHLAAPHMAAWGAARAEMGMTDRQLAIFEVAGDKL